MSQTPASGGSFNGANTKHMSKDMINTGTKRSNDGGGGSVGNINGRTTSDTVNNDITANAFIAKLPQNIDEVQIYALSTFDGSSKVERSRRLEAAPIEKLKISWATTMNFVDYGVFVMCNHYRTWDCGFPKDKLAKKAKCSLLRKKYVFKMLTSDVNIHKDGVIKEAR
ncbi:hypothetical protein R6Q59_028514 [Mikania micrantha]